MGWTSSQMSDKAELFERYRLYYICLAASPLIEAEQYVKHRNVGELYFIIDETLHHKEPFEVIKSIDVIAKLLRLDSS